MFRQRRWWIVVALVGAIAVVPAGCLALRGNPKRLCKGVAVPDRYDHVVIVVMENKRWSDVLAGQGPWLTARKNECNTATNYAQAGSPSRPNYIALTAGVTYGCEGSNSDPPGGCTPPSPSVFKQVIDAGGTAVNYLGGAQSACDLSSSGRLRGQACSVAILRGRTRSLRCQRARLALRGFSIRGTCQRSRS